MKKIIILTAVFCLVCFTGVAQATRGGEGNNTGCNGKGNKNSPCEGQGNTTINNTTNNYKSTKNVDKSVTNKAKSSSIAKGGEATVKNSGNSSNRNTNVAVNKNDIKNKVNTNVDASSRNKNTNKQAQGQLQGQLQGQAQKAVAKQTQSANNEGITVEGDTDNSDNSDNSVYLAPPPTQATEGTHSVQVTTPFGGAGYSKDAQYMILKKKMDEIDIAVSREFITDVEGKKIGRKLFKKFIKANNNVPLF